MTRDEAIAKVMHHLFMRDSAQRLMDSCRRQGTINQRFLWFWRIWLVCTAAMSIVIHPLNLFAMATCLFMIYQTHKWIAEVQAEGFRWTQRMVDHTEQIIRIVNEVAK